MRTLFASPRRAGLFALLVFAMALPGCSRPPTNAPHLIFDSGTVRYVDLEGGFFAIYGDGGAKYDPINLPPTAQVEGQRVRFVAETRPDLVSVHMFGTLIEIHELDLLP